MLDPALLAELDSWTVDDSRRRGLKRWSRFGPDVIDLTVAEMDLPTAKPIMDSLRHSVDREAFGYPLTEEYTDFQPVATSWLAGHGLTVDQSNVFMLSDVIKGMVLAIQHLTKPGSPVAVLTPTYSAFFDAMWVANRTPIEVAMLRDESGEYHLDLGRIADAFKAGAGALLLCNPSNPTGKIFTRDELESIAALAAQYDVRVISDEVHAPVRYVDTPHVPFASVSADAAHSAVTLSSASKSWNIPGLRCAVIALTRDADRSLWDALPGGAKGGISPLGIYATLAAFQYGEPWLEAALTVLKRKRDLVVDGLNGLGFGNLITTPSATYLGWVDVSQFNLADPAQYFLENSAIALTDGVEHGQSGRGFVRINLATPDDALEAFIERTNSALKKLR